MSEEEELRKLEKKLKALKKEIVNKDLEILVKEKMIEIASKVYGVDIKKKFGEQSSGASDEKLRETGSDVKEICPPS